jgi:hypothetical protein
VEIQLVLEGFGDPAAAAGGPLAEFSGTPEYNKSGLRILHCSVCDGNETATPVA